MVADNKLLIHLRARFSLRRHVNHWDISLQLPRSLGDWCVWRKGSRDGVGRILLTMILWTLECLTLLIELGFVRSLSTGESSNLDLSDPWHSLSLCGDDEHIGGEIDWNALWDGGESTTILKRNSNSTNSSSDYSFLSSDEINAIWWRNVQMANLSYPTWNDTQPPDLNAPKIFDNELPFNGSIWFNNQTLYNDSLIPKELPKALHCVCNCSYVSYACCNAPDGIVYEPASNNQGVLTQYSGNETTSHQSNPSDAKLSTSSDVANPTAISTAASNEESDGIMEVASGLYHAGQGISIYSSPPVSTVSSLSMSSAVEEPLPSPSHQCTGSCTSVSRGCSWAYTGECICTAPRVNLFFLSSGACARVHKGGDRRVKRAEGDIESEGMNGTESELAMTIYQDTHAMFWNASSGLQIACPCNSTCVSYGCCTSLTGLVQAPKDSCLPLIHS